MNIPPVGFHTVNDYPLQFQKELEMKGVTTAINQINESHEERKKEIDEITRQIFSG